METAGQKRTDPLEISYTSVGTCSNDHLIFYPSSEGWKEMIKQLESIVMTNVVTGVVQSKRRDGAGIQVNGEWYSSYQGKGLESVQTGHHVEFTWAPSKDGRFKNIKSIAITGGAPKYGAGIPGAVPAASSNKSGGYSNVGVELGHASKLAWELALQAHENPASDEFYKYWIEHTQKVYRAMSKLRTLIQSEAAAPAPKSTGPVLEMEEGVEESIF